MSILFEQLLESLDLEESLNEGYYVDKNDPSSILKYHLNQAMLDIEFKNKLNPSRQELIDTFEEWLETLDFDDEMDEGLLSGLANAAITIGNAAADAIQKDQETFESLDEACEDSLDESITDKGDIGPKVLAKLEEIINNNTKFKLDTDPDGKMILTDPKQLQFKVDIDGNDFILMDKSGKAIIRDADPEKFIKRFIVFVTD